MANEILLYSELEVMILNDRRRDYALCRHQSIELTNRLYPCKDRACRDELVPDKSCRNYFFSTSRLDTCALDFYEIDQKEKTWLIHASGGI